MYQYFFWESGRTNILTLADSLSSRLVGHLGGFLFYGRSFCTEGSFDGHSGVHCGNFDSATIILIGLILYINHFLVLHAYSQFNFSAYCPSILLLEEYDINLLE